MSESCAKLGSPSSPGNLRRAGPVDMTTEELTPLLASCSSRESKVGGPHCPGKAEELTLTAGVANEQAQGCECGRAGPVTCLPYNIVAIGEMSFPPLASCHLQQAGELAQGS